MTADARPAAAHLCGRLHTTLWALDAIRAARPPVGASSGQEESTARFPRAEIEQRLAAAGAHMIRAKGRGGDRAEAATEVFREIPELIPAVGLPQKRYTNQETREFSSGAAAQLTACREKYGPFLQ